MGNNLSANAPIWTRWHQERALIQEMDKDLSNAGNKKYVAVSVFRVANLPEFSIEVIQQLINCLLLPDLFFFYRLLKRLPSLSSRPS